MKNPYRLPAQVSCEQQQYTKYYSGNYVQEYHYIFGGDGLTAVYIKENGKGNMHYIHKDHLGSVHCITGEAGNLENEMSFDAWGRRRNPNDWTYNNFYANYIIDRGYTGHEHLDEFSLINMNGRVYDPILGRFLSPDNYIQSPDYTQSMNRYSYCLNNPLIYTDPSGEFWGWIGAMFGNYVIGGMDNWVNKGMSFNQAFSPQYNPVVLGGSYSPGNNTWSNSQVTAQQMPGILGEGQQTISNYLAGFSGWTGDAPIFPDLSMPTMEGGVEFVASSQGGGVGQPGTWESLIPVWGSGRAAVDHFQNGNYWRGLGYSALAISDVFLVKSLATAAGRGAWKLGAHSWSATRSWLGKNGYAKAGQPVHHWAISQSTAKKYGIEAITNQPWNLKTFANQSIHMRAGHGYNYLGQPGFGTAGQLWYGTPIWPKAVIGSYGGRGAMGIGD